MEEGAPLVAGDLASDESLELLIIKLDAQRARIEHVIAPKVATQQQILDEIVQLRRAGRKAPAYLVGRYGTLKNHVDAAHRAMLVLENGKLAIDTIRIARQQQQSVKQMNAALRTLREQLNIDSAEELVNEYQESMQEFATMEEEMTHLVVTELPIGRDSLGNLVSTTDTSALEAELEEQLARDDRPAAPPPPSPPILVTEKARHSVQTLEERRLLSTPGAQGALNPLFAPRPAPPAPGKASVPSS